MFDKLSCTIANKLVYSNTILKSDRELYEYGLRQMFMTILNILTTILIGLMMGMIFPAVIFTLAYIPIRIYAGGYHASTPQRCWAISAVILFIVLCILKYITESYYEVFMGISLISCIIIVHFSPVEDLNKPLEEKEALIYHLKAILLITIEITLVFILQHFNLNKINMPIQMVWIMLSLMLIIGKIKNILIIKKEKRKNKISKYF